MKTTKPAQERSKSS